jgi:serine/threonine protein kinase
MEMQLPKTIRGYELRERIGDGGFGAVHRAYQPVVEREVAIKVILPQYANKPSFVRNFEAEARIVAHLEHPFIVPLFDYWRDPDGAYLVMRFFPLGSLKRLLDKQGPLPIQKVSEILMQITGALDTAHRHHVIHRDIKPENILMDEEGNAFMADFGIAKREDQAKDQAKSGGAEQEDFSGTLAYAPPELLNREGSTAQSDIYSLGYVVYEMLTGKHAFADQSPVLLLLSHMEREIPAIEGVPDAAMAA